MKKSTKISLILSCLMMVVSVSMLVGTTFAWFTDSASTGVNKIQAGNLDVEFEYWNGTSYVSVAETNDTVLFGEKILWEPGHVEVRYVKIKNAGSLTLKYNLKAIDVFEYQFAKNAQKQKILISDYIKVAVVEDVNATNGFDKRTDAIDAITTENTADLMKFSYSEVLESKQEKYYAVVVYMPESVGNEANPVGTAKPWIRFTLALAATQAMSEEDSFGSSYDEKSPYPAALEGLAMGQRVMALNKELNKSGNLVLASDLDVFYPIDVTHADAKLYIDSTIKSEKLSQSACISVENGAKLTIEGNGVVDGSLNERTSSINYGGQAVCVAKNGELVINGGTFIGKEGRSCIYTEGGSVTINGGLFKSNGDGSFVVNKLDNSGAVITITGGTFVNFNPAQTNTEPNAADCNFVAAGYKVVTEVHGTDTWYIVVPK